MNAIPRRFDVFSGDATPYRSALVWAIILLFGALPGCDTPGRGEPLRRALLGFSDYSQKTAERTVMRVKGELEENEPRDRVDSWQSRIIEECNRATSRDNPVQGLFDVWMLCRRLLDYFNTGESAAVLGETQTIVADAARRVHDRIEAIAAYHLGEEAFQKMKEDVTKHAREDPIRGTFPEEPPFSDTDLGKPAWEMLSELFSMPLRVVEGMLESVDPTSGLAGAVDRFGEVVDEMPRNVREEAKILFDQFDKSQPELQKALGLVRDTAQSVEGTVAGVPEAAWALEATADAIGRTTQEIVDLWATSDGPAGPASSDEQERFRLQEVTESAEAWTRTAEEFRGLMGDFRQLLQLKPPYDGIDAVGTGFERMGKEIRGITTHACTWAVALMGLLFVLMLLYRGITNRFLTPRSVP